MFDQHSQRHEILEINYSLMWPTFNHEEGLGLGLDTDTGTITDQ